MSTWSEPVTWPHKSRPLMYMFPWHYCNMCQYQCVWRTNSWDFNFLGVLPVSPATVTKSLNNYLLQCDLSFFVLYPSFAIAQWKHDSNLVYSSQYTNCLWMKRNPVNIERLGSNRRCSFAPPPQLPQLNQQLLGVSATLRHLQVNGWVRRHAELWPPLLFAYDAFMLMVLRTLCRRLHFSTPKLEGGR